MIALSFFISYSKKKISFKIALFGKSTNIQYEENRKEREINMKKNIELYVSGEFLAF